MMIQIQGIPKTFNRVGIKSFYKSFYEKDSISTFACFNAGSCVVICDREPSRNV